jgi:hypothetical protein
LDKIKFSGGKIGDGVNALIVSSVSKTVSTSAAD